jgi:hypothetical protein
MWKPLFTRAEAAAYVRDSYYQRNIFYHGTSGSNAKNILKEGTRLNILANLTFGSGFYANKDRNIAEEYALLNEQPAILALQIKAVNPKIFKTSIEFYRFIEESKIDYDDEQGKKITQAIRNQGFDAIEIKDLGTVVVFEKVQIAVFDLLNSGRKNV